MQVVPHNLSTTVLGFHDHLPDRLRLFPNLSLCLQSGFHTVIFLKWTNLTRSLFSWKKKMSWESDSPLLTTTYRIKFLFLSMAYKVLGSVPVSLLSLISTHCHHPLHHTTLTFPLTYWHLPRFILSPLLFPLLDMLFLSLWVCLSYFILQGPSINVINPLCLPQLSPSPLRD